MGRRELRAEMESTWSVYTAGGRPIVKARAEEADREQAARLRAIVADEMPADFALALAERELAEWRKRAVSQPAAETSEALVSPDACASTSAADSETGK